MGDCNGEVDRAYYYAGAGQSVTIASLRHVHCDCIIELRHSDSGQDAAARIEAHRAVLARATYFGALFDRSHPDRVENEDADGKRVFRAVYSIDVPFCVDSIALLVECLYAPDRVVGAGDCVDPVDVVNASLFMGVPAHCICGLVEVVLASLCATHADSGLDSKEETATRIGSLMRSLLYSDIDRDVRAFLLMRTWSVLPDADRVAIADDHADIVPLKYYRPEAVVGDLVVDDNGCRWRTLRIGVDNTGARHRPEIAWQGLVFGAAIRLDLTRNKPKLVVDISCVPEGENLGAWSYARHEPNGTVDVEPRAVRVDVHGYHPTLRSTTKEKDPWSTRGTYPACILQEGRYAMRGGVLPEDAVLGPHGFSTGVGGRTTRLTRPIRLTQYVHNTSAMRRLVACEVEIRVEEIDS
ncbi:hypothetical protein psal_cds_343 [Pandoravirus salinus]|uniref:BTB domain-containing protein n=1 Tax=Pandoravirus salinus TaxID=1349410 RepID=S4VU23_9VIRU|nr:hypothetical protein psal_cds_343 [Pandoravirus salinus]AGO83984.1 hypothetical protein psal_cds_343 [Pandoravirus salinus]